MCSVLGISRSGYYAWARRGQSLRAKEDAELASRISAIHGRSRGTYGAPRIHAELAMEHGVQVGKKRVARLMRELGLVGVTRRKFVKTTVSEPGRTSAPDLVERTFEADGPNQLWIADITYVPTLVGFVFLAVVIDVWSRRVVGWSFRDDLQTELVLGALAMAVGQRKTNRTIHHSDQGCQYTSHVFGERCKRHGIRPSTGSVGDCYDNAMCESFFATLECELLDRSRFKTRQEARHAIFEFIEGWYNTTRRHSGIGYLAPVAFERLHDLAQEKQAA
jgi:putative transposase